MAALFRRGKISTGKACELLSLDRLVFGQRAAELGIPYFQMTKEDWEDDKAPLTSATSLAGPGRRVSQP